MTALPDIFSVSGLWDAAVSSLSDPVLYGRQLAGADAYAGATRTLEEIWSLEAGPVRLIIAWTLVLVLGSLAAGAGVGGGGLFVPIYWLILGAGPKGAVPLSKATILGGAIGNFLSLSRQRHPKTNRPIIDYEASTFMQSGELLGVVFGVLLNKLLPSVVIIVFLIIILGQNAFKTISKARQLRAKETAAFAKAAEAPSPPVASKQEGITEGSPAPAVIAGTKLDEVKVENLDSNGEKPPRDSGDSDTTKDTEKKDADQIIEDHVTAAADSLPVAKPPVSDELAAILREEAKPFPRWAWLILSCMILFTMLYSFVKKVLQDDPGCIDAVYWLWYILPVFVLTGFMYATAVILGRMHARKVAAGYEFLPTDLQWTKETLFKFPKTALMAGIAAGLLGIGGGMVIGPLFLSIGMEPQVGTSSCAFMILWTAFSGVVAYGADEKLGYQLALCCISIGFVSGQIGQRGVNAILKKTGRPSYVVFLLGGIIGTATVAMSAGMLTKMIQGDYNADDEVEAGEALFYLGTGFGCER
jgi:uncharacterized membrane protein YfcA